MCVCVCACVCVVSGVCSKSTRVCVCVCVCVCAVSGVCSKSTRCVCRCVCAFLYAVKARHHTDCSYGTTDYTNVVMRYSTSHSLCSSFPSAVILVQNLITAGAAPSSPTSKLSSSKASSPLELLPPVLPLVILVQSLITAGAAPSSPTSSYPRPKPHHRWSCSLQSYL